MLAPSVTMRGISRRFGHVVANRGVSLELAPGTIHALVGENGAGKSTLMRILYGLLPPDEGQIMVDDRPVRLHRPADAMRLGIGMVHQHFMLVDRLTVAENITLGREPQMLGAYRARQAERDVTTLAQRHGMTLDPHARIGTLSVGAQQRVEILKALYRGARVLILDEPTAVLTPQEVDDLFAMLRELKAQGTTIVLITHKLGEVKALADHVTVMRAGEVVADAPAEGLSVEAIATHMVGRPIPALGARADREPGAPLLEVRVLDVLDDRGLPAVRRVSFDAHAGEIVGIAGVEGNGQHELVESLAGLRPPLRGDITIAGHRVSGTRPREHFRAGLAHIPSDRLQRGLVPDMSLAENLILGRHDDPALGRGPWLSPRRMIDHARPEIEAFDVRPRDPLARAGGLSGGNQQKLIAARELSRNAPVLLAAHPPRGVDLGAVAFIHSRLLAERDAGRAVVLVSSELSEILSLADRIFVMFEGEYVHETRPADTDEPTLGIYMTGRRKDAR
jgi:simple sugar transport system ATP-binding protein